MAPARKMANRNNEIRVYEEFVWRLNDIMSKEKIGEDQGWKGEGHHFQLRCYLDKRQRDMMALRLYPGGTVENKDSIGLSLIMMRSYSYSIKAKAELLILGKKLIEVEYEEQPRESFEKESVLIFMKRDEPYDIDQGYF